MSLFDTPLRQFAPSYLDFVIIFHKEKNPQGCLGNFLDKVGLARLKHLLHLFPQGEDLWTSVGHPRHKRVSGAGAQKSESMKLEAADFTDECDECGKDFAAHKHLINTR